MRHGGRPDRCSRGIFFFRRRRRAAWGRTWSTTAPRSRVIILQLEVKEMDARGFAQNRASSSCMHVWHNRLKADEPAKLLSNNLTALQYIYLLITTSRLQNPSRCVSYLVYTDGRLHNCPSSGSRFTIFHPVISSTPPKKDQK